MSEESLLNSKGLSDRVVNTILASRKKVTQAIYVKFCKVFCSWLDTKKVSAGFPAFLEFLQDGADQELAISTLKVQVLGTPRPEATSGVRPASQQVL